MKGILESVNPLVYIRLKAELTFSTLNWESKCGFTKLLLSRKTPFSKKSPTNFDQNINIICIKRTIKKPIHWGLIKLSRRSMRMKWKREPHIPSILNIVFERGIFDIIRIWRWAGLPQQNINWMESELWNNNLLKLACAGRQSFELKPIEY